MRTWPIYVIVALFVVIQSIPSPKADTYGPVNKMLTEPKFDTYTGKGHGRITRDRLELRLNSLTYSDVGADPLTGPQGSQGIQGIQGAPGAAGTNGTNGTNGADGIGTATSVGTLINSATAKTTPVDADMLPLMDSAASNIMKKLSWTNIKATLLTYFNTLYHSLTVTFAELSGKPATQRCPTGKAFKSYSSTGTFVCMSTATASQGAKADSAYANYSVGSRLGKSALQPTGSGAGLTGLSIANIPFFNATALGVSPYLFSSNGGALSTILEGSVSTPATTEKGTFYVQKITGTTTTGSQYNNNDNGAGNFVTAKYGDGTTTGTAHTISLVGAGMRMGGTNNTVGTLGIMENHNVPLGTYGSYNASGYGIWGYGLNYLAGGINGHITGAEFDVYEAGGDAGHYSVLGTQTNKVMSTSTWLGIPDSVNNATMAIGIAPPASAKYHTGFFVGQNSIVPTDGSNNNEAIYIQGGSSAPNDYTAIRAEGYLHNGVDLSSAIIAGDALVVGASQTFYDGTNRKTLSQLIPPIKTSGTGAYYPAVGTASPAAGCATWSSGALASTGTACGTSGVSSLASANVDINVSASTGAVTLTANSGQGANKLVKQDANATISLQDGTAINLTGTTFSMAAGTTGPLNISCAGGACAMSSQVSVGDVITANSVSRRVTRVISDNSIEIGIGAPDFSVSTATVTKPVIVTKNGSGAIVSAMGNDGLLINGDNSLSGGTSDGQAIQLIGTWNRIQGMGYGGGNSIYGGATGGTHTSPSATPSGAQLLTLGGIGFASNGSNTVWDDSSKILLMMRASEAWTSTAKGTDFEFQTTANGTTTRSEKMRLTGEGSLGVGTTTCTGVGKVCASGGISLGSTPNMLISSTAPTISSGFGTSPSITANNGPVAFRVNVGTGGTAGTGVIGLPTAATGWNCFCNDMTNTVVATFLCKMITSTTTTATLITITPASVLGAWVASDILAVSCFAY